MNGRSNETCIIHNLYLAMLTNQQQAYHPQQSPYSPIHTQPTHTKLHRSTQKTKLFSFTPQKHSFQPYEKGQKIIQSGPQPVFRIKRKSLQHPSVKDRIKTDPTQQEQSQPVNPFFQKYISKSMERRKLRPLSLSSDSQQCTQQRGQFQIINSKISHIFFDPSDLLFHKKIIKLPERNQLREKYHKFKLKQLRSSIRKEELLNQSSHPLQSRSLDLPAPFQKFKTDVDSSAKLKALLGRKSMNKSNRHYSRRYQQEAEEKGEQQLAPWSFYNQQQP